ncbi:Protein CBG25777 [Caenorhabditis briggsae]|uniref:Protein CBG25777 n=1 Tax=Caenorhabditis briggsae TaxID=6238 RepID=B6IGK0_CAEBR|nr:Protein CBG25777 [Caenorhabditis briggsae]CAR99030.1 Protein CBG25777 [Caenorhabditis briggsae]
MSSSKNHKSAFKLWLSDSRPFLEERFKNLSNEELSKKISEIWRTGLQPDVKKSYLEKEKELKEKGTMSSNFSFWILAKLRENGLFDERMSVKENWKYLKEETKNWYKEEFVKYRSNPVENLNIHVMTSVIKILTIRISQMVLRLLNPSFLKFPRLLIDRQSDGFSFRILKISR